MPGYKMRTFWSSNRPLEIQGCIQGHSWVVEDGRGRITSWTGYSLKSMRFAERQIDKEERAVVANKVQALVIGQHLHFLIFRATDNS